MVAAELFLGAQVQGRRSGARRSIFGHEPDSAARKRLPVVLLLLEETRPHVHVQHATGEAKFRLEPTVEVAQNVGLSVQRLRVALRLARGHADEIRNAWQEHFGR